MHYACTFVDLSFFVTDFFVDLLLLSGFLAVSLVSILASFCSHAKCKKA